MFVQFSLEGRTTIQLHFIITLIAYNVGSFLDTLPSDAVRTCPLEELSLMGPTLDLLLKDVGRIVSSLPLVSVLVSCDYLISLLQFLFFVDYHYQFVHELVED